ncbi:MAG: sigma-70 family RNA polymerase sigma factor [Burkholderiaceae bacterium]|nr:sigma-70 family RNA polymerase sigma factor [Burkholderiaceae bacterium]
MADRARFEQLLLPHLDAAYGLARWLLRDDALAEDAVQEAFLRAWRFLGSLRGEDGKPWLLKIVRNACFELMHRERLAAGRTDLDDARVDDDGAQVGTALVLPLDPLAAAIEHADHAAVRGALRALPAVYREALVLRELQGCSYKQIAAITGVPIGTVMSRLSRARRALQWQLAERMRADAARR